MVLTEERKLALKLAGKKFAYSYFLASIAVDHAEEGELALEKVGFKRNEIKMNLVRLMKQFDVFFTDFKKYLSKDDGEIVLRDFEQLKPEIDKILDLKL